MVWQTDLAKQRRASLDHSSVRDVELERVTWLTLRRTYSSWAHEKGVPGKVIAQLMGHAKVDTTLNVYTQVVEGSLRRAADTVGSELFTIVHKPEKGAGANSLGTGSTSLNRADGAKQQEVRLRD